MIEQRKKNLRHKLALLAAALAVTAAAVGLLSPLRDFYFEMADQARSSQQAELLQKTADRLLNLSRNEESRQVLQKAIALRPLDDELLVKLYVTSVNSELADATDFNTGYGTNKHFDWVPLIAEGYRLAGSVDSPPLRSRVLSSLGLLLYFDPMGPAIADIEQRLRRAIELDAGNSDAWLYLGFSLQRQSRMEDAYAAFKTAVEIAPDKGLAWGEIASYRQQQADFKAALDALQKAFQSRHGEQRWFFNLMLYAQRAAAEILSDDLYKVESGRPSLGLDPEQRLQIIEQLNLHKNSSNRMLYARALRAAGQNEQAFNLANQVLGSIDRPRDRFYESKVEALVLLSELLPLIKNAPVSENELQQVWDRAERSLGINGLPPDQDTNQQWLLLSRGQTVIKVTNQSIFGRAGVRVGDRLATIAGRPIGTPRELQRTLAELYSVSGDIPLLVDRPGTLRGSTLQLLTFSMAAELDDAQ